MELDFANIAHARLVTLETWDEIESTNDRALELAKSNSLATPALIVARNQSNGRGQRGRSWWSTNESLTLSWCFTAVTAINPLTSIQVGLCVLETIERRVPELQGKVRIKWPNDILIQDKKVAGILVETVPLTDQSKIVVVGVGINVNQSSMHSTEMRDPQQVAPTSLRLERLSRQSIDLNELLHELLDRFYERFIHQPATAASIVEQARERIAFLNRKIQVSQTKKNPIVGHVVGISPEGALLVESTSGEPVIHHIFTGTIRPITPL